jgi:hypothetical protein
VHALRAEVHAYRSSNNFPPRDRGGNLETRTCNWCHKGGHLERDCRQKARHVGAPSSGGGYFSQSSGAHGSQHRLGGGARVVPTASSHSVPTFERSAPRTFARRADTDRKVVALTATAISRPARAFDRKVVVMSAIALPRTPEPDVSNDGSPPPTLVGDGSDD